MPTEPNRFDCAAVGDAPKDSGPAETIEFLVATEEKTELDRLVTLHGGDRSEFLREAMRVMAARERAERLQQVQERIHAQIGGPKTSEQVRADVRRVIKRR